MVPICHKKAFGERFWFRCIKTTIYDNDLRVEIGGGTAVNLKQHRFVFPAG